MAGKTPTRIEIEAVLSEGSAERATGQLRDQLAATAERAERAASRRLGAILKENDALRAQIGLLQAVSGSAVPGAVARGRAHGRAIRSTSTDAEVRAALEDRAALEIENARLKRRLAGQLRAGERGVARALDNQALGFQAYQLERQIGGPVQGVSQRALVGLANRYGGYDALAAGAKKAGISLQEFIRIKSGATAAEARNEKQLKSLNAETDKTDRATKRATGSFAQMGRVLRSLFTAFVGFQALRGIQKALGDVIDFQAKLQNVRLGVAEILLVGNRFRDRVTGQLLPIADQVRQSFQLAERGTNILVEKAIQLGLPLDNIIGAFQTVAGIAQTSGVKFEQTLDIITQIGVVAQRLNIPFNQLTRSIDNIFTGLRVQQTQLGVILGLNQSIVQQQIQQGTLGNFLLERLQGVAETLPENLKTFEGIKQSVRSLLLDITRQLTGGAFQVLQDSLTKIRERLLSFRKDRDAVDALADSFTKLAESIAKSVERLDQMANSPGARLLGAAVGGYAGYRLGGRGGAAAGAAYGAGLIGPGLAGSVLTGALVGGAASRYLTAANIGAASGAAATGGRFLQGVGSAALTGGAGWLFPQSIAAATGGLAKFALGLGVVGAALAGLVVWIDSVQRNAEAAATSRRSARASRRASSAFDLAGRIQQEVNPENLAEIRRLAFDSGANPQAAPVARALAETRLRSIRESVAELQGIIPGVRGQRRRERLQSYVDDATNKLVEVESSDPFKKLAERVERQLKLDKDGQKLAADRLAVLKAQNELTVQQIEGQRRQVEFEKEKLDLQEQVLRASTDRQIAEARLGFLTGAGRERSAAASRESLLQGRVGRVDRLVGLAEGLGRTDVVAALQAEKARLQQEIFDLQKRQQNANVTEAQGERDAAAKRLADEQKIADQLPERLRIEREILNLKIAQAAATAGAAAAEQKVAQEQLTLLAERVASTKAERDRLQQQAGQTLSAADPVNKALADYQGLEAQFKLKSLEAQGRAAAAATEAEILQKQGRLSGQRGQLATDQQATKVADAAGQLEQATQGVTAQEAKRVELGEQRLDLILDEIEAQERLTGSLNEQLNLQKQFIGNAKQFLSDIFQGQDFSDSLKNFSSSITRSLADGLSNATVDFLQGKANGSKAGFTEFIETIGKVFDSKGGGLGALLKGGSGGGGGSGGVLGNGASLADVAGQGGKFGGVVAGGSSTAAAAGAGAGGAGGGILGGLAGAASAGGGAVTLGAIAAIAGTQGYLDGLRRGAKGPLATPDRIAREGREKGIREAANIIPIVGPILGKALTKATSFIKVKDRGSAAASGAATGAAIGTIVPGIGNLVGAVLGAILGASTFGAPTAGTLQQRFLAPSLAEIGLDKSVRFGPGDLKVYSAFRGANARRGGLPASYSDLRGVFAGFGEAGKQSSRGEIAATGFAGLDDAIAASVLGAAADLGLSAVDAFGLGKDLTKNLTKDFRKGSFQLLAQRRRGRISQEELVSGLGGLTVAYSDLALAIDSAALAQAAFTKDGTVSLKSLENAATAAKTVIEQGLPKALSDAVANGNPARAAESLAQTFTSSFLDQLGRSLVESGGIQKALSQAVALSTQAADAFAAGDTTRGNALLQQASQSFITGRNAYQQTVNRLYPSIIGFNASVGVYGPGGIINPSGSGLPGYATPSAVRVPGAAGTPRLAVVHGGEVIRDGAHNDQLVAAMNNLADAQRAVAQVLLSRGDGDTNVQVVVGDEVVASTTRKATRRDSLGQGIKKPVQIGVG